MISPQMWHDMPQYYHFSTIEDCRRRVTIEFGIDSLVPNREHSASAIFLLSRTIMSFLGGSLLYPKDAHNSKVEMRDKMTIAHGVGYFMNIAN